MEIKLDKNSAFTKMVNATKTQHPQIIPYLERYLDLKPCLNDTIVIDDFERPPRKKKERFNPSSDCERCMRQIYYEMCGKYKLVQPELDGHLRMIFNIGTVTHSLLQAYFKDMNNLEGFPHEYKTGAETRMWCPELRMSGYIDEVLEFPNWEYPVPLEIKTISSYGFSRLKSPKSSHRWQLGCYMVANEYPAGILLYVNKDNQTFKEFWVEEFDMQPVLVRWNKIQNALDEDKVDSLPHECLENSKIEKECPFADICKNR